MTLDLRVLAYNLEFGGRAQMAAIATVLAHCRADLIALTEADDREVVETLAGQLGYEHVWARGSGARHIATLSRWPITRWAIHNRPPLTQAVLMTEHATPAGPLTLYNVHFLPYLLLPFELRRWQAVGRLLAVIRQDAPGRHLILGDLNAIAPGDRVLQKRNPPRMKQVMLLQLRLIFRLALPRLLRAGYVDCFRHLHPAGDGFTWWTINPTTRYDYILANPQMTAGLRSCRVVDDLDAVYSASDHFPLQAEFDLSAG